MHKQSAPDLATLLAVPDDSRRLEGLVHAAWTRRHEGPGTWLPIVEPASELASFLHDRAAHITTDALLAHAHFLKGEYTAARAAAFMVLGHAHLDPEGDPDVWDRALARLAIRTCEALALAATNLAMATFRLSDYPNGVLYANLELHLRRWLGDAVGAAMALHGLGWGYDKVGLYQKALEHHMQSLAELEAEAVDPARISAPLNGIAATYLNLGHIEKALEHSQRSLAAIGDRSDFQRERSTALRTIGTVHQRRGDHHTAERYFRQSMAVSDEHGVSLNLLSLGEMYLDLGRHEEALKYFQECLKTRRPDTHLRTHCEALLGVGEVYLASKRPTEAVPVLEAAVELAREIGLPIELYRVHHALSRAYRPQGKFDKALEHFESFHRYREQLLRDASDVRTQVLSLQFDVERMRKDREIDRLRNVELARAYQDLQGMHRRLEKQAAELERLSNLDGLTGLHNRRSLDQRLDSEVDRARRGGSALSLVMLDIDNFKDVNDRYSHTIGDEVLKRLAQVLRDHTRSIDLSARFGGEEFVVLLPGTDPAGAHLVAENIRAAFEAVPWAAVHPGMAITVSAGVATIRAEDDGSTLLARADAQLYRAKLSGKNCVCISERD